MLGSAARRQNNSRAPHHTQPLSAACMRSLLGAPPPRASLDARGAPAAACGSGPTSAPPSAAACAAPTRTPPAPRPARCCSGREPGRPPGSAGRLCSAADAAGGAATESGPAPAAAPLEPSRAGGAGCRGSAARLGTPRLRRQACCGNAGAEAGRPPASPLRTCAPWEAPPPVAPPGITGAATGGEKVPPRVVPPHGAAWGGARADAAP